MPILLIILVTVWCLSCGNADNSTDLDQDLVTVPTPLPNIYIDEKGNSIKQDGWIPVDIEFGAETSSSKGTANLENGETIEVVVVQRSVLNTFIETPSAHSKVNERYGAAKAIAATSFAIVGKRPYCHVIAMRRAKLLGANDNSLVTGPLIVKYCDLDGDGIFETLPKEENLTVPKWALSN